VRCNLRAIPRNCAAVGTHLLTRTQVFSKEPNIAWSDGSCVEFSMLKCVTTRALRCVLLLRLTPILSSA
jgi:hypothetical protein